MAAVRTNVRPAMLWSTPSSDSKTETRVCAPASNPLSAWRSRTCGAPFQTISVSSASLTPLAPARLTASSAGVSVTGWPSRADACSLVTPAPRISTTPAPACARSAAPGGMTPSSTSASACAMSVTSLTVPACAARSSAVFTPPFSPAKKTFTGAAFSIGAGAQPARRRTRRSRKASFFIVTTCEAVAALTRGDFEHPGVFARVGLRDLDAQTRLILRPGQRRLVPQQPHRADSLRGKGVDHHHIVRFTERDGKQPLVLGREADVLPREGEIVVVELPIDYLGRTFAGDAPRPRAVDRFAVDLQPAADLAQERLLLVRDRAIRLGADVQQQTTVLADDVDQMMDDRRGFLVNGVADVTPGVLRDRCAGLPRLRLDLRPDTRVRCHARPCPAQRRRTCS